MTAAMLRRAGRARQLAHTGRARELREAAGILQIEMARAVGVDVSTFAHWENDGRTPRDTAAAARWCVMLDELAKAVLVQ
jgi:transcriptional regulator with XRE-family HTH domain